MPSKSTAPTPEKPQLPPYVEPKLVDVCEPAPECAGFLGFCKPLNFYEASAERALTAAVILSGIAAVAGTKVIPLWNQYIWGGVRSVQDLSTEFGVDFTSNPATAATTTFIVDALRNDIAAHPPRFPAAATVVLRIVPSSSKVAAPGTSPSLELSYQQLSGETINTAPAPHISAAMAAIHSDDKGETHAMKFDEGIPGNIAGGIGRNQKICPAGAIPSTQDDDRRADVSALVSLDPSTGELLVEPSITFIVDDTIDFCPGNCGSGPALAATIILSRWEKTGISGDVPFTLRFSSPTTAPFTIAAPSP